MTFQERYLVGCAALAVAAVVTVSPTRAQAPTQPQDAALNAEAAQNDWPTYHGTYKSYHYSGLDQINAGNFKNLEVAWMHFPERATRGIQSTPLALDGVLYYSGSYSRIYALDGATGKTIWAYAPELDEELVSKQTHSPYNRGIAIGHGNLYVGTVDGRLIALNLKDGKPVWDTKLLDSKKVTVGFTGAPLVVKDKVIIGAQGGEWPHRGPIFGVDGKSGQKKWEFLTVAGTEEAMKTWGGDSWRTGGGGGWMPGTYDPETNSVWWGTANPGPLYDWSGADWKKSGPRPGDNLYTTSVIALDPDTGKLKSYFQELPHDAWDFDSAVGEFVMIERDGKSYIVHANKGGFVFVYDPQLKVQNVWQGVKNINFVKSIDPKTGELIGRRDLAEGKHQALCPYIDGGKARGHVTGRDPITGAIKWQVEYAEPPLASLLSTKGNLVFVPDARGWLHALDARTGAELWKHNDGQGHNGGIISYMANGKQYIAVATGWGGLAGDDYKVLYGEPWASMPTDQGMLVVFGM